MDVNSIEFRKVQRAINESLFALDLFDIKVAAHCAQKLMSAIPDFSPVDAALIDLINSVNSRLVDGHIEGIEAGGVTLRVEVEFQFMEIEISDDTFEVFIPFTNVVVDSVSDDIAPSAVLALKNLLLSVENDWANEFRVETIMNSARFNYIGSCITTMLDHIWSHRSIFQVESRKEAIQYFYIFVLPYMAKIIEDDDCE